jgi:hypothetical protein
MQLEMNGIKDFIEPRAILEQPHFRVELNKETNS